MKNYKIIPLLVTVLLQCQPVSVFADTSITTSKDTTLITGLSVNKNITTRKYILGPNDVLSINVYDSPEFSQENVRVQPDGKLVIEPLGSLQISGMTIDDLQNILIQKYKHYLNDPRVSIKLEQTKPFIVYVTGGVLTPGSIEISTNPSSSGNNNDSNSEIQIQRKTPILSNVLIAAGGISYDADLENIRITNTFDNSEIRVNLLELLQKSDASQDIYLMAGDVVHVPKLPTPLAVSDEKYREYANASFSPRQVPVKVFGYINHPGLIKLESAQSLNINSAITAAGGYLTEAAYAPKKVYLSRTDTSGKLVTRLVNPMENDVTLMPNDIIYVPEKARPTIGKAFDYISRIAAPINTYANTYNGWALMFDQYRYIKN